MAVISGDTSTGVIRDPRAVALFDAIDYDYRKFGRPSITLLEFG